MSVLSAEVLLLTEVTLFNAYLLVGATQSVGLVTTVVASLVLIGGLGFYWLVRDMVSGAKDMRPSDFPVSKLAVDVLSRHTFYLLDV